MRPFNQAITIIRSNWRSYVGINILFYGMVICGMVFSAFHPEIQKRLLISVQITFKHSLSGLVHAYASGNVPVAATLTFVVNALGGAFASITLPSLVIPFSGFIVAIWRPTLWGVLFSPTSHRIQTVMIFHSLTLLMEGQAYVLAAFGSYLSSKWFLFPATAGCSTHGQGYRAGLIANLHLYKLILAILAVSALYEAIEVTKVGHILPQ